MVVAEDIGINERGRIRYGKCGKEEGCLFWFSYVMEGCWGISKSTHLTPIPHEASGVWGAKRIKLDLL